MLDSRTSALHQLHRALTTSPTPLPDTIFSLNFQDQPFGTSWSYSRPADPSLRSPSPDARDFPMPHFSFWAWPLPFIGSMERAGAAVAALESATPFARKDPRAVWRGTSWFNSAHAPRLRQDLIVAARGKAWANVEVLRWTDGKNASNALMIEDFCRYKYVVHTEGVAYSGRFQFLQMCASVTVTPPIMWMQHLTHLVRPVFSGDLLGSSGDGPTRAKDGSGGAAAADGSGSKRERGWVPSARVRKSWPRHYAADEANIVFVAPDWRDLEETILWLERNPKVAEGIANRQRSMFVGGGYFSRAAETCYWRALVRGWAKVAKTEGMGWDEPGKLGRTFEAFALVNDPD